MSKRNISYIKPQEPSFIRKLKEQIGYKEGPTVDSKREDLAPVEDEDDVYEERPTIVVLQPGDLTAEEAEQAKEVFEKEISEAPADLNARIVFKVPEKSENSKGKKRSSTEKLDKPKEKRTKSKALLSFDDEEDDDE